MSKLRPREMRFKLTQLVMVEMVEEGFEFKLAHCNCMWPVSKPPGKRTKRLEVAGNLGCREEQSPPRHISVKVLVGVTGRELSLSELSFPH